MIIRTNIAKAAIALAIVFGSVGIAAPAIAADDASTVTINAKGYDLTSPDDVARLQSQAHRAAASVCKVGSERDLGLIVAQRRCFKDAVASIDTRIAMLRRKSQGETQVLASANINAPVPPVTK
jgi:UrcA family protein